MTTSAKVLITWSSTMGLFQCVGTPAASVAGGQTANHIIIRSTPPATAAGRSATPSSRATPIPSSPGMNNVSIPVAPANEWKKPLSGPPDTLDRNRLLGAPPWIHALALDVA